MVRALVLRWALWLFILTPLLSVLFAEAAHILGFPVQWAGVAEGVAEGVALGVALGVASRMAGGVAFGVALGVAGGLALGVAGGMTGGVARGVALGVPGGLAYGVAYGVEFGVAGGVAYGVAAGVAAGVTLSVGGVAEGVAGGMAFGVTFGVTLFRLPYWIVESVMSIAIAWFIRIRPKLARGILRWVPYSTHDLIYLPLPGIRSLLLQLAITDVALCKNMISEAAASVGQKRAARLALVELQARDLEKAASGRLFARAATLDFPFLPDAASKAATRNDFPILSFQAAAKDLIAGLDNARQRRIALDRAYRTIDAFRTTTASQPRPSELARRLLPTANLWLDVIRDEQQKLSLQVTEVPPAFIAGSALTPDDAENRPLFKGRDDIIKLIGHDLSPDRRGVLVVTGQRRMGKTSLRNYLPTYLGTGTVVIPINFQELSGDPRRAAPHLTLLTAISAAVPSAPSPPDPTAWGDALRYLRDLDKTLTDHTLLVVIDEVERLEDGIRAGWTSTDFLDFLRAAGDALRRIRFLLLTAYPLHRLGPHWVDRLVSVTSRSISYLDEPDARDLMVHPIPDFPDIYPDGGVDRILAETGRHPYLLQKVGDELVRLLNGKRARKATNEDLEKVFDNVITGADLFDELWRQRTDDEKRSLQRMATAGAPIEPDAAALQLVREGYVEKRDGKVSIAVPLFREWITETQGGV